MVSGFRGFESRQKGSGFVHRYLQSCLSSSPLEDDLPSPTCLFNDIMKDVRLLAQQPRLAGSG